MITGDFLLRLDHPQFEEVERCVGKEMALMYEGLLAEPYATRLKITGAVDVVSPTEGLWAKVFYYEIEDPELEQLVKDHMGPPPPLPLVNWSVDISISRDPHEAKLLERLRNPLPVGEGPREIEIRGAAETGQVFGQKTWTLEKP